MTEIYLHIVARMDDYMATHARHTVARYKCEALARKCIPLRHASIESTKVNSVVTRSMCARVSQTVSVAPQEAQVSGYLLPCMAMLSYGLFPYNR